MLKTYHLPYGKGEQSVALPEDHVLYDIKGEAIAPVASPEDAVRQAIEHPIESDSFESIFQAGQTVAIVVSDITRLCMSDVMLKVLVEKLNACGIADSDITIIVATGTHRGQTDEEDRRIYGEDIVDRISIIQHDCHDEAHLSYVGTTSRGNAIYINSAAVQADKLIITGAVSFHPMAGYGGGRKAVVPGIAGFDTIMRNHCHALADRCGDGCNPNVDVSILDGNPFHEDMKEACGLVQPDFLVNTLFTTDGDLFEVVAGHWYKAWEKGCQDLLQSGSVNIHTKADVTIASAGGYPKDLNLYQSIKAYMNAIFATKPGGIMILTLECPDIKEPAVFTDWFFRNDMLQWEKDLRKEFNMAGFVAFKGRMIIFSLRRVYVVTREENFDFIKKSGQVPAKSLEEAWALAQKELEREGKDDYTITVIGHASATFPVVE